MTFQNVDLLLLLVVCLMEETFLWIIFLPVSPWRKKTCQNNADVSRLYLKCCSRADNASDLFSGFNQC